MKKLHALALGYATALVAALTMLFLGIAGNLGFYSGAVEMMVQWHMFFSLSFGGIIAGVIEASVISFVFMYLLGWFYNRLAK